MYHCADCKNHYPGQLSDADRRLAEIVGKLTDLTEEDLGILLEVSHTLPFICALEGGDVYIDILTKNNHLAVVVAQHSPPDGNFYGHSLVGEVMWRKNEPGVYRTLEIGVPSRELKAVVSDKEIIVRQNVSAITNRHNAIIGALIVEKNLHARDPAERPAPNMYPTAYDSISSSKEMQSIVEYVNDAMLCFNIEGVCVYANPQAKQLYRGLDYNDDIIGLAFENLSFGNYTFRQLRRSRRMEHNQIKIGKYSLKVTCTTVWDEAHFKGAVLIIKDTTEIETKEKQLVLKSAAIDEMHHRVKNNLQTVVSLIGLQANRSDNAQVQAFSKEIISRIYSISLTHEILAHNGIGRIGVKELLSRMLNCSKNYIVPDGLELDFEIFGDEILLQSDTATAIAMIVNELVQNSIKHAFVNKPNGRISISIQQGEPFSRVAVSDDGIGLQRAAGGTSIGLKLVKSLVTDKLKGSLELTAGKNGLGTRACFTFFCDENG